MQDQAPDACHRDFVARFAADAERIKAYVFALMRDWDASQEVFQQVSISLWERFADYDPAHPFLAWALGIARHKALHEWRRQRRQLPVLSPEAMAVLEPVWVEESAGIDSETAALNQCLERVDGSARRLLDLRYRDDLPLADIAGRTGQSLSAVTKTLARLRDRLADCVRGRLGRPA